MKHVKTANSKKTEYHKNKHTEPSQKTETDYK